MIAVVRCTFCFLLYSLLANLVLLIIIAVTYNKSDIGDYNDFISVFCGDDFAYPMPSNKTEFSDIYSDIYIEELIFRDGTSCSSTVYELRTGRIQYRFILGNCIFSIWKYNGGSIPNQTWQKMSFDYYSE